MGQTDGRTLERSMTITAHTMRTTYKALKA